MTQKKDVTYRVLVGLNFPRGQRREPGDTVKKSELPKTSLPGLLAQRIIEPEED